MTSRIRKCVIGLIIFASILLFFAGCSQNNDHDINVVEYLSFESLTDNPKKNWDRRVELEGYVTRENIVIGDDRTGWSLSRTPTSQRDDIALIVENKEQITILKCSEGKLVSVQGNFIFDEPDFMVLFEFSLVGNGAEPECTSSGETGPVE